MAVIIAGTPAPAPGQVWRNKATGATAVVVTVETDRLKCRGGSTFWVGRASFLARYTYVEGAVA